MGEESLSLAGMGVEQNYNISLQNEGVVMDNEYWENQVQKPNEENKNSDR